MRHPESRSHKCNVIMATVTPRRMLIFKIQRNLTFLNANQLLEFVKLIDDGSATHDIDDVSELELYDMMIDYLRSEKLGAMEDEGVSQLLLLDDMMSDLLAVGGSGASQTTPGAGREAGGATAPPERDLSPPHSDNDHPDRQFATPTTDMPTQSPPQSQDRDAHIHPPSERTDIHTLPAAPGRNDGLLSRNCAKSTSPKPLPAGVGGIPYGRVSLSSSSGDQLLRINEVAALLPRREFKVHGGQISDVGSDMSYSNLSKQIDEGIREGFTESEVIRTAIKVIKPGTFREMLTNKCDLSVDELKRFLRAHIRDKSSTELFQELSNARQQDKESPQQFLYKLMGLKQRVLFESQQPGTEFSYDKKLVQGTFLHTLYQGLNERNSHVRHDLKAFLTDLQVNDDFLLDQITKSTSEEAERLKRLGTVTRNRPVTVSPAQLDSSDSVKQTNVDTELQANRAAIRELTAQVSSLTKHLAQMAKPPDSATYRDPGSATAPPPPPTGARGKCNNCVQQSQVSCPHCFVCGQVGHRAIGCLQRRMSGNGSRSLERGNQ